MYPTCSTQGLPVVSSSHEPTATAACGKYSLVEREGDGQLISPNYRVALARSSSLKVGSSSIQIWKINLCYLYFIRIVQAEFLLVNSKFNQA